VHDAPDPADLSLGRSALATLTKHTIGGFAASLAVASHAWFAARGAFKEIEVERELAFGPDLAHRLDVWRPRATASKPRPLVLFFHGGGFQQLDKGSHWSFCERFADMGAVVFNADYRLAPQHRHPAAADDAARAYDFALAHAADYGADPDQLIIAGTSAGANLALGLAITRVDHTPRAAVLFSGLLQVSDMPRLYRSRHSVPRALRARIASIGLEYPPEGTGWSLPSEPDPTLDPLLYLERSSALPANWPATFISTGSVDQVLEDSLRLTSRLADAGAPHELNVLPGAGHAFQGFLFSTAVRTMWRRLGGFLAAQGLAVNAPMEASRAATAAR
jgi:acetyl esterase